MVFGPEIKDNPLVTTQLLVFREGEWQQTSLTIPKNIYDQLQNGGVVPMADEDSEEIFIKKLP